MPSIDVMIPNYNYGRYLAECVESALAQPVEDLRITIIDNCSTDDSVEVARALMQRDPRVRLVQNARNLGPHASYNRAIDLATAKYMIILCSDDVLTPGVLREVVDAMERHPDAACLLGAKPEVPWFGESLSQPPGLAGWDRRDGEEFIADVCRRVGRDLPAYAIFARTRVQKEAGHFRATIPHMDDLELVLRLALLGSVLLLGRPIIAKRYHEDNPSAIFWDDCLVDLQEREAAFGSFFANEGANLRGGRCQSTFTRRLGNIAYWSAVSHFLRGRSPEARRLFAFAMKLNPRAAVLPPIAHLFQMQNVFARIKGVLTEALVGTPVASKSWKPAPEGEDGVVARTGRSPRR